ncbi:MAG: molybdopterin-binding protein [Coriobacteriia bacterium]
MKISARNKWEGSITSVDIGPISALVKIDVGGQMVVSEITAEAAKELDLKAGDRAWALVKASNVLIGKD